MRITIVSNYLFPETGAAANRITQMAKCLGQHHDVTVLAPLPNYPTGRIFKEYKGKFFWREQLEGFKARRYWAYNTISKSPIKRLVSMVSFGFTMLFEIRNWLRRPPEIVIVQNSPLLVSCFAIFYLKLFTKAKIVLNVSDLWPLSALELGAIQKGTFYSFLERLERYNYKNSKLILGQSQEIIHYVKNKVPDKKYFLYRNIPVIHQKNVVRNRYSDKRHLKLVYAGLLGVAQGVFEICRHVDFKELKVEFHIYGKGNELEQIENYIKENPDNNIHYQGSFDAQKIREKLRIYDFAIVPLKNRIYGAVPSKIFELTLLHVPMLFCGGGEGAEIVEKEGIGLISEPGNFEQLADNIIKGRELTEDEYEKIVNKCAMLAREKYNFQEQIKRLHKTLKEL
jgi:glycosyltransferase involved in cell wall biosynthesis